MDRRATGLVIYRSNRLERLATSLGDLLSTPTDDAFAPECILVPGRGVAQWLSFELSRSFGVWANVLYLYPRNFVAWALERVLGKPLEELQAFDPERLLWSICATLPTLFELPEFEPIRRYVASDAGDLRFFELCRRIAGTFDRYAAYRPELLAGWERKSRGSGSEAAPQLALFGGSSAKSEGWQPILWRALLERGGGVPAGSLERTFARALRQAARVEKLPRRISCFGVTHLPPTYTRILVALGAHVPVHVFQLSPSERAAIGAEPSAGRTRPAPRASRPENPLLASLGTLASDFESVLEQELSRQSVPSESRAAYVEPAGQTRLERLQRQLLIDQSLRTRGTARTLAGGAQAPDESIQIHVCHSPMREVEVLYDQLMSLLASGTSLEARDVVVLTPDIETYAPLIEAVFRRASDDPYRIPYCIADRTLEASAPVATALDRLFGLARERLSTSQVLDLLALEPIAQRFEISSRDHEQITEWLTRTNVRWGIDAEHRHAHGHPAADANTWRLGLERLFLGYAMTNDPPALVSGVLPESGAGGSEAATLGKLATFLEALFTHVAAFGTPRPVGEWPAVVGAALDALVLNDAETAWQHRELRDCLGALARRAEAAGYGAPLSGIALRSLLFEAAESARPARGFLMGGVTFCSMVPLRSLPFRIVCLLGLGDGQFPRKELSAEFDLIASEGRRIGDRSRRAEDRYIFLEAILAARERLLITYTGQSIRDNSVLPPSVVVSELCDYLALSEPESVAASGSTEASRPGQPDYVVRHPLQAFSPRYFDGSDPRLFSYAPHALGTRADARASIELFRGPLPAAAHGEPLALLDLVRFYQNPTAFLLNRRLELFLRERELDTSDREPQELSPLDKFSAGQDLLELVSRGMDREQARALLTATSALPLGSPGELDFLELSASAQRIAELDRQSHEGERLPPRSVRGRLPSGCQLFGILPESYATGPCEAQFARVRPRHLLRMWIHHLMYAWLGAIPAAGGTAAAAALRSSLIGRPLVGDGAVLHQFLPVQDPVTHLEKLVQRFQDGLSAPLMLFPTTSHAFVRALRKGTKQEEIGTLLEKEWQRESSEDSHLARVYGDRRAFSELRRSPAGPLGFEALASEIFEPLLDHLILDEHEA